MAKRDKLSDRLDRLRVDFPKRNERANGSDNSEVEYIVVDSFTEQYDNSAETDTGNMSTSEERSSPDKTYADSRASSSLLSEKEMVLKAQEEAERQNELAMKKQEEEFRAEQERKELREQKEREKRERKELQEQKKREREAEKDALRKAKLERQRLEEERKLQEEQARRDEKARLSEIERAEKEKQAEIEKAEREKQLEIQRAEQEKRAEIEKAEREKREALERLELEKQEELEKARRQKAEEIARAQKEAEAELNKIEQEKKALLEKARNEEIERQAEIEKQRIAAKAEAERAEKARREEIAREQKARKAEIARERKRKKEAEKRNKAKEKLYKAHTSSKKHFSIFNENTKAYDTSMRIRAKIKGFFASIISKIRKLTLKKAVLGFLITFCAVCVINHIPNLIFNIFKSNSENANTAFVINDNFADAYSKAALDYPDEDFDADGIPNAQDDHPFDSDFNKDGIIDSDGIAKFTVGSAVKVGDLVFETDTPTSGITKYLDIYDIDGLKDKWIKCVSSDKTPYAYYDNAWHEVECESKNGDLYLKVPEDDCKIKLLESKSESKTSVTVFGKKLFSYSNESVGGKILGAVCTLLYPKDNGCPFSIGYRTEYISYFADNKNTRDIIAKANVNKINEANLQRFSAKTLDGNGLDIIYTRLKEGKTSLLSLQSDKGEIIAVVYGCDILGNLYAADYRDLSKKTKLEISITTHLIKNGNNILDVCDISFSGGKADSTFRPVLIR